MTVSDKRKQLNEQPGEAAAQNEEGIEEDVRKAEARAEPVDTSRPRRMVASYPNYADAERAVDWLSDQGFAVERSAIVGRGLRSEEQVTGRMTSGRAALLGLGYGALIGALFAVLFGIFFTGPHFGGLLLYSLVVGALFGGLLGVLFHAASGGQRDFVSAMNIVADRYDLEVTDEAAEEAKRLLDAMPVRR